jgi:hypothetical protein
MTAIIRSPYRGGTGEERAWRQAMRQERHPGGATVSGQFPINHLHSEAPMPSCPNCGSETHADARFCHRCGAPLRGDGSAEGWEVCEIVWWRGYVKSEFHAVAEAQELARSPRFRWRSDEPPPPDHQGARAAHDDLVERLTAAGWEPLGEADPWYAQRFRRQISGLRLLAGQPGRDAGTEGSAQS